MSADPVPDHRAPTVASAAFPDGREGLFGVRDTSTIHAALVAFALSKMSLHSEPVPVIRIPESPESTGDGNERGVRPRARDVVGSIRVAQLRELEADAPDDPVADHMGPVLPSVSVDQDAATALTALAAQDAALVLRGDEIVGVVTRSALRAAISPYPSDDGEDAQTSY